MTSTKIASILVGLLIAIYWARVLHLARKIRRAVGHTANVIPPGPLSHITRIIWFPVVGLWIALPIAVPLTRKSSWLFEPLIVSATLAWSAFGVALLAFALTLICWKKMGTSWRMGIDPNEKTVLIVTGPFAIVRHPIYALSSLLMLATVAVIPSPMMLIVAAAHLGLLQLESRREEKYLRDVHGPAYLDYCRRVPRFIPRPGFGM